jgi:pimeloyl-ACP methyl ester carboxylesterase
LVSSAFSFSPNYIASFALLWYTACMLRQASNKSWVVIQCRNKPNADTQKGLGESVPTNRRKAVATYVIVHGGFSGGYRWRKVANLLRAAGQDVFTPTLTGLGERAHLASPKIDLGTHIQDIVGVLECEDLWSVILVGHSSGSMVITGVAEKVPERLAHLVYVDTAIPQDGESWLDLLGPELSRRLLDLAEKEGGGWQIPLDPDPPRIQPHPLKTVTDPIAIRNPAATHIPRTFIHCTAKPQDSPLALAWLAIDRAADYARRQGWRYRTLPTDHSPHHSAPGALVDLLIELA